MELEQKLGKYQLQDKLGEGGMGAVYLSRHPHLNRPVAIKVLPPSVRQDSSFHGRFQREGQTMAALNHPNIIRVYDVDEQNGLYYMVMDFVEGGSLEQRLKSGTPMGLYWACDLIARVAEALSYAHRKGVIHRDIKPANILLTSEDDPVVADFGIARMIHTEGENLTAAGMVVGTPAYMSPEQILAGEVDGRSDLYSLGIVLYQLLTGRLPFMGDTMTIVTQQINAVPPPLRTITPDLPAPLEQVVLMALAKRPQDRFGSGAAFAAAIRNALQSVGPAGFVRAAPVAVSAPAVATVHADQAAALPQQPGAKAQQEQMVKLAVGAAIALVLLIIAFQIVKALFVPLLIISLVAGAFYLYQNQQKQKALGGHPQPGPALPTPQWGTYVQHGLALYRNGQFPEALAAFNQALQEDPGNVDALISRGLAYYTLGDLPQAESDFQAALTINPRHPRALYQRALVHQALGLIEDAIGDLQQVLSIIPAHAPLRREAEARLQSLSPNATQQMVEQPVPTRDIAAPATGKIAEEPAPPDATQVYPQGAPPDATQVYPQGGPPNLPNNANPMETIVGPGPASPMETIVGPGPASPSDPVASQRRRAPKTSKLDIPADDDEAASEDQTSPAN